MLNMKGNKNERTEYYSEVSCTLPILHILESLNPISISNIQSNPIHDLCTIHTFFMYLLYVFIFIFAFFYSYSFRGCCRNRWKNKRNFIWYSKSIVASNQYHMFLDTIHKVLHSFIHYLCFCYWNNDNNNESKLNNVLYLLMNKLMTIF